MTLWMGWLTCGARVAVAASEGKRGARVSSARLTRGAKVAATAGELRARGRRWAASWATRARRANAGVVGLAGLLRAGGPRSRAGLGCEVLSFSFFHFSFLIHYLNSNLV